MEKGIRKRRLNLENTVESMWALGTINKKEKVEFRKKREMWVGLGTGRGR